MPRRAKCQNRRAGDMNGLAGCCSACKAVLSEAVVARDIVTGYIHGDGTVCKTVPCLCRNAGIQRLVLPYMQAFGTDQPRASPPVTTASLSTAFQAEHQSANPFTLSVCLSVQSAQVKTSL